MMNWNEFQHACKNAIKNEGVTNVKNERIAHLLLCRTFGDRKQAYNKYKKEV